MTRIDAAIPNKPLCIQIVSKINSEDFLVHPIILPKIRRKKSKNSFSTDNNTGENQDAITVL